MAKKYFHGQTLNMDCANIGVLPDTNYRKDYGDQKVNDVLCHSIAQRGWLQDKPTKIILANDHDAERARMLREAEWAAVKEMAEKAGTPAAKLELQAWEATYTRKGKVPTPEFLNVITFRRFSQLAKANYLRMAGMASGVDDDGKAIGTALPPVVEIPAIVCFFSSPAELRIEQFQENMIDNVGKKATTPLENLNGLVGVFQYTKRSTDFQRALTGTTEKGRSLAQKYLGILKCNQLYPEIELLDRLNRPAGTLGYIPLDKLDKECVRTAGDGQLWNKRDMSCTTPLQVLEWHIAQITAGKPPRANPMLDRETISTMSENHNNEAVKRMMTAVKTNNLGLFNAFDVYAPAFNALQRLIDKSVPVDVVTTMLTKLHDELFPQS